MVQSCAVQPKRMTSYHNTSPLWQKCPCFFCSCFWGFVQNDKVSPLLFFITHTPWACMGWPCTQLSSVTIEELSAAMAVTRSVLPGTLLPVPGTEKSTLPFEFQSAKQSHPRKKKSQREIKDWKQKIFTLFFCSSYQKRTKVRTGFDQGPVAESGTFEGRKRQADKWF